VLLLAAQGDQDVEGGGGQGQQRGHGVGWVHGAQYIQYGYIVNGYRCTQPFVAIARLTSLLVIASPEAAG
jgi:hypothetical protein